MNPIDLSCRKQLQIFAPCNLLAIWVKMNWNIEESRNLFIEPKSKTGFLHIVKQLRKCLPKILH